MTMRGDPGGDFGMGDLHEERPSAGEQQRHLTVYPPDLAVRSEKSFP
jgi:hypothetical protein